MLNILLISLYVMNVFTCNASKPLVVNTWPWPQATDAAWTNLQSTSSALDAVEAGCTKCEQDQCDGTVGFGGSPDENGETTLDAMIMDGSSMNVGSVGCLRRVKNAIGVARKVLDNTKHTLLVGELATQFAKDMGFTEESLSTESSIQQWKSWKEDKCQPNYRVDVTPDPSTSCGPYSPRHGQMKGAMTRDGISISSTNHDTIGMVAISNSGNVVAGTSTNGLRHKVPGRVGDSPVAGAGAYADDSVGGAVATGDGDVMMRFLPAYQIVESMRRGISPRVAAQDALERIIKHYPDFSGALIGVSKDGDIGASCIGFSTFKFCVRDETMNSTKIHSLSCQK